MPAAGGPATRLTPEDGWYTYELSPDETRLALTYGNVTTPTELFVMPAAQSGPAAAPVRLTRSTTDEFRAYTWATPEVVTFKDADGIDIHAQLIRPRTPHPARPAVVYVHGAGYAQAVNHRWSDTLMFWTFLADNGYTVLNVDYRGSSGYGRDCGRAVYRSMGDQDVLSAIAGADYLVKQHRIDRRRIGIYGGSYGGFFTLMALFRHPGVFAAGAALYPVTDWAHYNNGYTSRILNMPFDDDEAYRRSSPIYFADGLRDRLLILHGIEDNNVHFQDTVRLVQRLIELKKVNWDLAIYPIEAHGWQEESSRLDSNRRIFKLFEETLKGPRPASTTNE
jgi:dipeptidyl aminopeptidase/acylaminoacyl peptidase